MSAVLLHTAISTAQVILAAAMALCLFRMIRGPRAQDRILALDAFYIAGMLLLITARTQKRLTFDCMP